MDQHGAFSIAPTQEQRLASLEAQVRLLWGVIELLSQGNIGLDLIRREALRQGTEPALPGER